MKEYYVVKENYADCQHVIGLGKSREDALEEPLNNGFEMCDMILESISEEQYEKYIEIYT